MKKKFTILFFSLFLLFITGASAQTTAPVGATKDTVMEDSIQEDQIIDEIVATKKLPKEEKVQYFSQLTRYGFKNLFSKYSYNPNMPYSSQVNPYAESYMQDYLKKHSKQLLGMKDWGLPYFNLIDNIFAQYGLPRELKYLAVIESNLSVGATSWVGASGPWQFMPYTAREYGLVVNANFDERRDYIKSTHAAARYLLTLYKQMHDWLLVIAAYNGGPGRVNTAIRKTGNRNFWNLQYSLPEESRNHVKKFIATHYVMEAMDGSASSAAFNAGMATYNPSGQSSPYNKKPVLTAAEMELAEKEMLSGKYNSVVIAKNITMDIASFNRYNPGFDAQLGADGQYEMILPGDKMQVFLANKYTILNESVQLLLGDNDIPVNKTVYPPRYNSKRKN